MIGKEKIFDTLSSVLKKSMADQSEVLLISGESGLTRYANSFIHQNVSERNARIIFRVAKGKKIGICSTNSFKKEDLLKALSSAYNIALMQKENPDFPGFLSKQKYVKVKTTYKKTADFSPMQRAEVVKKICDRAISRKLTAAGSFATGQSEIAVLNTNGLSAYQPITSASINLVAMSEDSSGFAEAMNRDVSQIDFEKLTETAIQKCLDSKKPRMVEPGEYDVILEPVAVANLLEWLSIIGLGARQYQEGTSFMCGKMGEKVMGDSFTLTDDGADENGVPFPFDFEGMPKQKVVLIDKGVAKNLVYDSQTAYKDKVKSTGHALPPPSTEGPAPLNLFVKAGNSSTKKMIESMEHGLLVTRFHYINGYLDTKNALMTGMTRDGTFRVENGKIKNGVKNLRFTESMLKAFSSISLVAKQREIAIPWWGDLGAIVAPSVLIKNFKFTGKTEF
ncbi:MAG: TldD/PmbA family protein [candidate division Zixibacteria bacterium]|nr:TldD/PmbA family protein [candidate division Zixibacteria bacterium]